MPCFLLLRGGASFMMPRVPPLAGGITFFCFAKGK
jgi:hypothetical protein